MCVPGLSLSQLLWSKFGIRWLARTGWLNHPRNRVGRGHPRLNFGNGDRPYPWVLAVVFCSTVARPKRSDVWQATPDDRLVTVAWGHPIRFKSFFSLSPAGTLGACLEGLHPALLSPTIISPLLGPAHPWAQPGTGACPRVSPGTQGRHCPKLLIRDPLWESFQPRTMSFWTRIKTAFASQQMRQTELLILFPLSACLF